MQIVSTDLLEGACAPSCTPRVQARSRLGGVSHGLKPPFCTVVIHSSCTFLQHLVQARSRFGGEAHSLTDSSEHGAWDEDDLVDDGESDAIDPGVCFGRQVGGASC
jgi:hypothetical protein